MHIAMLYFTQPEMEELRRTLSTFHVFNKGKGPSVIHFLIPRDLESALTDQLNELRSEESEVQYETHVFSDISNRQVLEYCNAHPIDLVIVKFSDLSKQNFWQRRISSKTLLHNAYIPLVILKDGLSPITKVLVCESGAGEESNLRSLLRNWEKLFSGDIEVTVLHVMSQMSAGPGVRGWQLRATTEEILEGDTPEGQILTEDIELLRGQNVVVQPKVRHGLVVNEILKEIEENAYDLVVLGAHPNKLWSELILEDISQEIIELIKHPVVIIPNSFAKS